MKRTRLFTLIKYVYVLLLLYAVGRADRNILAQTPSVPVIPARHLYDLEADFLYPSDVAVGAGGRVYVADGVNGQVKIFDSAGKFLSSFGEKAQEAENLIIRSELILPKTVLYISLIREITVSRCLIQQGAFNLDSR